MNADSTARLLEALRSHRDWLCDDCWSLVAKVSPRQQVNQIGRRLANERITMREKKGVCSRCRETKDCSRMSPTGSLPAVDAEKGDPCEKAAVSVLPEKLMDRSLVATTTDPARVWHWEGNVQHAVVEWLREHGWSIASAANTASKAAGVDVIARRESRELWVTVKGFPELRPGRTTPPPMQARHWFAGALMDVVMYRQQRTDVEIALALPGPFPTYDRLVRRVAWLMPVVPFWVFVVGCSGRVCPDREFP